MTKTTPPPISKLKHVKRPTYIKREPRLEVHFHKEKLVRRSTMWKQMREWLPIIGAAFSFLGLIGVNLFLAGRNVATIPYVDAQADQVRQYAKEEALRQGQKAIDHSDFNKQSLMTKLETYSSDMKALSAKQDLMLDTIRQMENRQLMERQIESQRPRK